MQQNKDTTVCVLMPVFNAQKYLKESIQSVLVQTYREFTFLIINDGSTDNSEEVILSFNDERIWYQKNDENIGLIKTLNKGLKLIDSKYIVRMDADDICALDRIEKQVDFMNKNPQVAVCGSAVRYFGDASDVINNPIHHDRIKAELIFSPKLVHPSTIIRTELIKKNNLFYSDDYKLIEDYEFWTRIVDYGQLANLSDVLLFYRWEGQNITSLNWETRDQRYKLVYKKLLRKLDFLPTEKEIQAHLELSFNSNEISDLKFLFQFKNRLLLNNSVSGFFPKKEFIEVVENAWSKIFYKVADQSTKMAINYFLINKKIKISQIRYVISILIKKVFKKNKRS